MGCIALVRCVLVLRYGLAGVVWCGIRMQAEALLHYLVLNMFRLYTSGIWCGIRMQVEALLHYLMLNMFRIYTSETC